MGYAALTPYARRGSAVSAEAQVVTRAAGEIIQSVEMSQMLFGEKSAALSRLTELSDECAVEGWDGGEAFALDEMAVRNAGDLVRALPKGVPLPEFAPEPDGSISLDWIQSRHRLFSVSVGRNNRLAYAWLDGSDSGHGVAGFDGLNIPLLVLAGIQSILSCGHASLRAA